MNEHKAVPNIRFKDFEDEWAEKKISNFIIKNSDKNKNLAIKNIESISNKTGFTRQSEQFDGYRVASQDISNYYVISPNQFAYNPSRINVGSIAYKNKGEDKSIISPLYISFSTSSHINDHFLWFWFKTTSFKKQRIQFSEGGVRDTLPFENLKKMEISFPLIQEQQKIGYLFAKLDKLLDLQQQKIDKLELLKKALLQKLFPKHDKKIPELRFKEFKNEWEKEKLKGYIEKVSGNDGRMNLPTLTISAAKGWMNQNERFSNNIAGKEQKNYTLLKKGELSYNHGNSKLFKYGVVYELINYDEALVPKVYHSFRVNSKASARFIEYLFRGKKVDRELRKLVTSGARMDGLLNINFNNFENIQLYFPEKAEQQKIGNLLSKVDQLIELENKKLQNFQQVKKCLLQNMFVE